MTTLQARQLLRDYCRLDLSCDECPLGVDGFRCGRDVSFMTTDDYTGEYDMTDDEVWEHYDAVAAAGFVEPRVVIEYELAPLMGLFE